MLILFIYLMSIIEGIKSFIVYSGGWGLGITLASIAGIAIYILCTIYEHPEYRDNYNYDDSDEDSKLPAYNFANVFKDKAGFLKKYFIISLSMLMLNILVPNQKVMAAMFLLPKMVGVGKSIASNKQVKQLPDKMLTLLNVKLDGYIADLTPKKVVETVTKTVTTK